MGKMFIGYVVKKDGDEFKGSVERLPLSYLPQGDVLVRVSYSSLNYKDALSAKGNPGVTRKFPHIPGIDAAGVVEESSVPDFSPGDEVVVTGYDLGMNTDGGFAGYVRVPAAWVVPLPKGLTLRESMILGTAGFTAALSVHHLIRGGVTPDRGPVLVTGATGGVGSIAVSILAKLGYSVTASSGKRDQYDLLRSLGAKDVIPRETLDTDSPKAFLKPEWAGAVDTVGGKTLEYILKSTMYMGSVSSCGLVGGSSFCTTVFPFIIRGITLYGVDSVECPMDLRLEIWNRLSGEWKPSTLNLLASEIGLDDLSSAIEDILKGKIKGRTLVVPRSNAL